MFEQGRRGSDLKLNSYFPGEKRKMRIKIAAEGAAIFILFAALVFLTLLPDLPRPAADIPGTVLVTAGAVILGAAFTILFTRLCMRSALKRYRDTRSSFVRYDLIKKKIAYDPQGGKTEKVSGE